VSLSVLFGSVAKEMNIYPPPQLSPISQVLLLPSSVITTDILVLQDAVFLKDTLHDAYGKENNKRIRVSNCQFLNFKITFACRTFLQKGLRKGDNTNFSKSFHYKTEASRRLAYKEAQGKMFPSRLQNVGQIHSYYFFFF
jgi:hypothetical protein